MDRQFQCSARGIGRRLALGMGVGFTLAPRLALAQAEPARERPREGDLLVAVGATGAHEPLKPDDLPLGGKQMMAWPIDPESNTVRDGSRLNKILLLRLDPEGLDPVTKERAAEGVVAYSAICTHTGCDVINWHADCTAPRMPVPLLAIRPEGSGQSGERAGAAPLAGSAIEDRRRPARRCQAVHRPGRVPTNVISENRGETPCQKNTASMQRSRRARWRSRCLLRQLRRSSRCRPCRRRRPRVRCPPILQSYKPVTAERLKQPEDGDWLMYRRTYDGWGYSPLSQITTENVGRLKPVWTLQTGQIEGHQAPPIVNNGVMFVATPGNQVLAIDAKKGDLLWRFKRPIPEDMLLLHPTSRGVGLLGDKVYFAAADAVLVALDAKTGKEVWNAKVEDYTHGYYMSLAPLVADGKVMVGCLGRRARRSRLCRGVRRRDRQAAMENLHRAGARRAGQRNLAQRRPVEDRRRVGVDHRHVRSRNQSRLLGHRQWRAVDGRSASGRQSLHLLDDRRSTPRPARSRATTNTIPTIRGTGTRSRRRSSSTTSTTAGPSRVSSTSPATAICGCSSALPTRSTSSTASRS